MVPVMHYVSITADAGVPLPFTFEIDVSKFEKNKVGLVDYCPIHSLV